MQAAATHTKIAYITAKFRVLLKYSRMYTTMKIKDRFVAIATFLQTNNFRTYSTAPKHKL